MKYPFISIIIPVYNSADIIGDCLTSLLDQDYPRDRYEIIAVDNNSTDDTAAVIKTFPVTYALEDKIQSAYAARNTGVKQAKGEALLFFDADQVVDRDFLRKMISSWEQQEYSAFAGRIVAVGEQKTIAGKYWHVQEDLKFDEGDPQAFRKLGAGNALVRRDAFEKIDGYDSSLVSWGDFDFAYRLHRAGYKIKNMPEAEIGHMERSTVKALLKREYRIGFGKTQFDRKHEDQRESVWLVFGRAFRRTLAGIGALVWGTVKPLPDKSRKDHLGMISLDIAMRWAYLFGRLHTAFPRGKKGIPAKW